MNLHRGEGQERERGIQVRLCFNAPSKQNTIQVWVFSEERRTESGRAVSLLMRVGLDWRPVLGESRNADDIPHFWYVLSSEHQKACQEGKDQPVFRWYVRQMLQERKRCLLLASYHRTEPHWKGNRTYCMIFCCLIIDESHFMTKNRAIDRVI